MQEQIGKKKTIAGGELRENWLSSHQRCRLRSQLRILFLLVRRDLAHVVKVQIFEAQGDLEHRF